MQLSAGTPTLRLGQDCPSHGGLGETPDYIVGVMPTLQMRQLAQAGLVRTGTASAVPEVVLFETPISISNSA
ncbi:MAG: hypothetical protein NZ843_06110 [Fimbriimonadales bacterium]|nr:hypothetical protein [Fimbriimonadales bacterium]